MGDSGVLSCVSAVAGSGGVNCESTATSGGICCVFVSDVCSDSVAADGSGSISSKSAAAADGRVSCMSSGVGGIIWVSSAAAGSGDISCLCNSDGGGIVSCISSGGGLSCVFGGDSVVSCMCAAADVEVFTCALGDDFCWVSRGDNEGVSCLSGDGSEVRYTFPGDGVRFRSAGDDGCGVRYKSPGGRICCADGVIAFICVSGRVCAEFVTDRSGDTVRQMSSVCDVILLLSSDCDETVYEFGGCDAIL